jgi:arylamine N-acetyltransferase
MTVAPAIALTSARSQQILDYLGCAPAALDLAMLTALVHAYVRRVPWESAFRIARKAEDVNTPARSPDEFWADALARGGGGTCFESNLAFFALLRTLGFNGYLTINNMQASIGCHTAIVVALNSKAYLADVGIPLHRPLLLSADHVTRSRSLFHQYVARPEPGARYTIERTRHPKRYIFTLIDKPVGVADYIVASNADYGASGLFLDRVIINKIIDDAAWRFSSAERPYQLERFAADGSRQLFPLAEADLAATLAAHFAMDGAVIARALAATRPA